MAVDKAPWSSFLVPVTNVPFETEGKSNNDLNNKFICTEKQFRAPVDVHSLYIMAFGDIS